MGVHNALNRGPLGKAVKGSLGDQDSESSLERWGETLTPVMDIWSMPEWAFMRSERLAAGQWDVTGGAGTVPEVMLINPPTSKFLVVVMHVKWYWIVAGAQFAMRIVRNPVPLGMTLPIGFTAIPAGPVDTRDNRLIAVGGTNAILATGVNAAQQGAVFDASTAAVNVPMETFDPIILAPNTALSMGPQAVGVWRMIGSIYWRERLAFQSELGF